MLVEEEGIEPVDTALVAASTSVWSESIVGVDVRFSQIVEGGDALGGHVVNMLIDNIGTLYAACRGVGVKSGRHTQACAAMTKVGVRVVRERRPWGLQLPGIPK